MNLEGLLYRADGKTRVNQNIISYNLSKWVTGGGTEQLKLPDGSNIVIDPSSVWYISGIITAIDDVDRDVLIANYETVIKRDHLNNTTQLTYTAGFYYRDNSWEIQPATFNVYVDDITEELIVEIDDGFPRNAQWECLLYGIKSKL